MAAGLKILALAGVGEQTVFETPVAATQYLALLNESIKTATTPMPSDYRAGTRACDFLGLGAIKVAGKITERMRYPIVGGDTPDPVHILLKNAFGSYASDTYTLTDSIAGLAFTFAVDKGVSVHETVGLKVQTLTLKSSPKDGLIAEYDCVGYDETQAGMLTTAQDLADLKNDRDSALHKDLTVAWVGDLANALASGDAVSIDSLEFKMSRPLDDVVPNGQRQIIEPLENGMGDVSLTLHLPRYATDAWRAWQRAQTPLQGKFKWTLSGKFITLLIPHMIIDGSVDIETGDTAPYSQQVKLRCFRNGSVNANMSTIENEAELNHLT
ncbi:phage tail tube protein [Nitrospira sp. Nam74]